MKFEIPQRRQLAYERTSLTLFAPAPSTISFVPLTRNLSLADPSPLPRPRVDRPLRGNCHSLQSIHRLLNVPPCSNRQTGQRVSVREIRYRKQPPTVRNTHSVLKKASCVRDAFSEAFGVKNRLLRYGRDILYRKRPPTVRNRHSATKKGSWGTRCIFKGPLNSLLLHRMRFQRRAEQPTPQTVDSHLPHRTHFQRRAVPKAAPAAAATASVRETPSARR